MRRRHVIIRPEHDAVAFGFYSSRLNSLQDIASRFTDEARPTRIGVARGRNEEMWHGVARARRRAVERLTSHVYQISARFSFRRVVRASHRLLIPYPRATTLSRCATSSRPLTLSLSLSFSWSASKVCSRL